ncbi:MAG: flagellar basal body P-ring formation chaperone FlgA [Halanaerobiales bacterium]
MKDNRIIYAALLMALMVLMLTSGVLGEAVRISIPEFLETSASFVRLGDIARIEGLTGEKLEEIKSINLGKTLDPGYTKQISRGHIRLLLQNKGFSYSDLQLDIPDRVRVKTANKKLTGEELIKFASQYLQHKADYPADRVEIKPRYSPPDITLPDRVYILEAELQDKTKISGNVPLRVLIIIDDNVYRKVHMSFQVLIKHEVYTAKRKISPGEKIKEDDFKLAAVNLSGTKGDLITDLDNSLIENGVVRAPIPKDGVLTDYYLTIPDIVKNGDEIKVEIVSGNIKVLTTVKARENGKKDEYIEVENIKTGHIFKARVIKSNLVRVTGD